MVIEVNVYITVG